MPCEDCKYAYLYEDGDDTGYVRQLCGCDKTGIIYEEGDITSCELREQK